MTARHTWFACVAIAALAGCAPTAEAARGNVSPSIVITHSIVPSRPEGFDLPAACQYTSGPVPSGQRVLWEVMCARDDAFAQVGSALQAQGWMGCGTGQSADGRSWQKADQVVTLTQSADSGVLGLMLSPRRIVSC